MIQKARLWLSELQRRALVVVLLFAIAEFTGILHEHYPIQKWLFWRYQQYWLVAIGWSIACVSAGFATLRLVLKRPLPAAEQLATSFAVGVYEFFLGMFIGGLFGVYNAGFFIALPLLMAAPGIWPLVRYARRYVRQVRLRQRHGAARTPLWVYPMVAFGLLSLGFVYFSILTPENVAFDSRWYHLRIAEHYVAEGAMRRFPEGWYNGASPHLASFLYTWAFLVPKSALFDKVELAAHIEFVAFLWTLVGIPGLVRLLVPHARARATWVARFLFPGIMLYDSSLCTGADHIAAVFAVPIFTLLLRTWPTLCPRFSGLFAIVLSGAMLTKYTGALLLVGFPILAFGVRTIMLSARTIHGRLRGRASTLPSAWYLGPAVAVAAGLMLTAPQWLKNWLWYGDPLYPVLHAYFSPRPWTVDSAVRFEVGYKQTMWRPTKDMAGVKESLKALFNFSLKPNDWPAFHGSVPVFGSLFTWGLFCMPFLRANRRLWALFACAHVGLLTWYWIHHQDRYLQAALPWMAAATAAVLILVWRSGVLARVLVATLVGLQIVWGGDVYFIPGHALIRSPIKTVADLLASGYAKNYDKRNRPFGSHYDIGRTLSRKSKVLIHEHHPHLGIRAMSVQDTPVDQGGISYGRLRSPREVYDLLKGYGVTHILYKHGQSKGTDSFAGDIMFFDFVTKYGDAPKTYGDQTLVRMPATPPPGNVEDTVAFLACDKTYRTGLYRVGDLTHNEIEPQPRDVGFYPKPPYPKPFRPGPPGGLSAAQMVEQASYVVIASKCHDISDVRSHGEFTLAVTRKPFEIWTRRAATTSPPSAP